MARGRSVRGWAWAAMCLLVVVTWPCRAARAWGADGHRIVGEIASHYLTPEAEAAVGELMVDPAYATLAETAVWADAFARTRERYAFANKLHYVEIPPTASRYDAASCSQGCVVSAIRQYARILDHPELDAASRIDALRFLVHFVGDLHQPLHVTHPDGHGGTRTEVTFAGRKVKAHWVWDTGILDELVKSTPVSISASTFEPGGRWEHQRWRWLAWSIRRGVSPDDLRAWASLDPEVWADESLAQAKAHAFLKPNEVLDPVAYARRNEVVVVRRLAQAGVRLALVLNAIFADGPLPAGL